MSSIYKVAELAGVSVATVSRVINNTGYVSSKSRMKVEEAIKALHYMPNKAAKGITTAATNLIGLLVPDINNPVYLEQAKGINDYLKEEGFSLIYVEAGESDEQMGAMIRRLLGNRVDGIILCSRDFSHIDNMDNLIEPAIENNVPVVVNGQLETRFEIDRVTFNAVRGAYLATEHLLRLGHTRIGLISGMESLSARERHEGYMQALIDHSISVDPSLIAKGDFRQMSGYMAMKQLLALPHPPTAVFVMNDVMAIGAVLALEELKVAIPDEMAIVGFDDIIWCSLIRPRLTSVVQPKHEIGKKLAEFLHTRIDGTYGGPARQAVFPARLAVRESTMRMEAE